MYKIFKFQILKYYTQKILKLQRSEKFLVIFFVSGDNIDFKNMRLFEVLSADCFITNLL